MTVLTALQSAAKRLLSRSPATIFSTTNKFEIELQEAANETVKDVIGRHDWRKLTKTATITGDGVLTEHALPSDYDRMAKDAKVYDTTSRWTLCPVPNPDLWLRLQLDDVYASPGHWIMLGGKIHVLPVIENTKTVKFQYQSNAPVTGGAKTVFDADADTFDLDERLITLGAIWRWRAQKRLEYAEDLANYETALAQEVGADKGARIIAVGPSRGPFIGSETYPRSLGA
jgi:hypothetical protein